MEKNMYDCIIIGCGPSGMTAGIYLRRAGKSVLILEKSMPGGQMVYTKNIENYPAFSSIDGVTLSTNMFDQVKSLGVDIKFEEVTSCDLLGKIKTVKTHKGEYTSKCVYIATGAYARPLMVQNEKKYMQNGISYCATCDGALFKGKEVAIVGGGNTSLEDCIYLSNIAKKVYLVHRRDEFRGDEISVNKVKQLEKDGLVKLLLSCEVVALGGEDNLENITILNKKTNTTSNIDVSALFVAIGRKPDTEFLSGINLDSSGYIIVDEYKQTNIDGVFAGGDVSTTPLKQIVTACSDGAISAMSISRYLAK